MAEKQTLYEILGVEREATPAQIKKAYYFQARKCHPDKFPGDESKTAQFQRLKAAYEELSDEEKREVYDRTGETGASCSCLADCSRPQQLTAVWVWALCHARAETERGKPSQSRNKLPPNIKHRITLAQLQQGGKVDVEIRVDATTARVDATTDKHEYDIVAFEDAGRAIGPENENTDDARPRTKTRRCSVVAKQYDRWWHASV